MCGELYHHIRMELRVKENRFGLKLYFYNLMIMSLLVGSLFSLFLWYYVRNAERETEQQVTELLDVGVGSIEDTIEMLDTIALQLSTNPNIIATMKSISMDEEGNYFDSNLIDSTVIYELFWSYILNPDNVSRVSAYNAAGDFIYAGDASDVDDEEVRDATFIAELSDMFLQEGVYSVFVNDLDKSVGLERNGVSIIREVKNSYLTDNIGLGYIEVALNIDKLESKILNQSDNQIMIIYDLDTEKVIGTSMEGYVENTQWTYSQLIQQLDLEEAYQKQEQIETYNMGVIVLQDLTEHNDFVRNMVILFGILYIWLILGMAVIQQRVVDTLMQPLIHLCQNVQYTKTKQDRSLVIEESNIYEIELLSQAFREMVSSLEESMQTEMDIRTSQTKTQLYALQAQMNPHFIHNTIAIIQSYALEENYDTVIDTCTRLSDLIRYSSRLTNYKVNLLDEIEHIKNYMALVKMRYEDNIEYSITLQHEMEHVEVPCFVLQPLIENSLNHGLKSKPFPWKIHIYSYKRENNWILELKDNGIGMSIFEKDKIINYKEMIFSQDKAHILETEDWEIGGLTIRNIMVRLYLEYGENMIFEIESRETLYTIVRLGGPLL